MLPITQEDIQKAFDTLETYEDEHFELIEIRLAPSIVAFSLLYKNKKVYHQYKVHIQDNNKTVLTIWTSMASPLGQKITRSINTTKIADRIIYHFSTYIKDNYDIDVLPDLIESKRMVRQLGTSALCYSLIIAQTSLYLDEIKPSD